MSEKARPVPGLMAWLIVSAAATVVTVPAPALAQLEGSTLALTCGQAVALVRSRGAAVLGTGGATYDRFVSDRRFCQATEAVRQAFVPTRDVAQCPIGYRCFEPTSRRFDF